MQSRVLFISVQVRFLQRLLLPNVGTKTRTGRKLTGYLLMCASHTAWVTQTGCFWFFHTAGVAAYIILRIHGSIFKKLKPTFYCPKRIFQVRFLRSNGT